MAQYKDFYKELTVEDYPQTWSKEEFENIRSFAGKLKYANNHLQRLASGSGRTVFKIDDQKVLKIAKNRKGLAQNQVESDRGIQNYGVTAKVFDVGDEIHDIGPFWIESEFCKKIGPKRFQQLTGVTLEEVLAYMTEILEPRNHWRGNLDPKLKRRLDDNEFIIDVLRFAGDYDQQIGDYGRASTWGETISDGKPAVVLVDFGLNRSVWNDYYKVK